MHPLQAAVPLAQSLFLVGRRVGRARTRGGRAVSRVYLAGCACDRYASRFVPLARANGRADDTGDTSSGCDAAHRQDYELDHCDGVYLRSLVRRRRDVFVLGADGLARACRTSILFSIVRVANPSQRLRRVASLVGCSFLLMWAALMGQRIHVCLKGNCLIAASVGLAQLVGPCPDSFCRVHVQISTSPLLADVISDASLVVLPMYFLQKTRIHRRRRIMIYSAFSASLLITVVSIFQSVVLFMVHSDGIIVIGHVKVSLCSVCLTCQSMERGRHHIEKAVVFVFPCHDSGRRIHVRV